MQAFLVTMVFLYTNTDFREKLIRGKSSNGANALGIKSDRRQIEIEGKYYGFKGPSLH